MKLYEVQYYTMSGGGRHQMLVEAESKEEAIEKVKQAERQPLDGIRVQVRKEL
jgi:hypothetical protein